MHTDRNFRDKVSTTVSPDDLLRAIELLKEIQHAMESDVHKKEELIAKNRAFLLKILQYLIKNTRNPNIDPALLDMLLKALGLKHDRKKEKQDEQEQEEEIKSEAELKRRLRLMIYEFYKVINPRRIAGETELDNFIANALIMGVEAALQFEGGNIAKSFTAKELQNLESHSKSFTDMLKKSGNRGGSLEM